MLQGQGHAFKVKPQGRYWNKKRAFFFIIKPSLQSGTNEMDRTTSTAGSDVYRRRARGHDDTSTVLQSSGGSK